MYKLELSEIFTCQLDREAYAFLVQYHNLVEWWRTKVNETHHSYSELRNNFYGQWRQDWKDYNSQHAQTSSLTAYNISKTLKQQATTKDVGVGRSFAVISPRIAKITDTKLVFPTQLAKKACVQLNPKTTTQKILLEQAQNGYWKIGQTFLTEKWCTIPLTRCLDLTSNTKEDPRIEEILKTLYQRTSV